jgi:hypothetical protein
VERPLERAEAPPVGLGRQRDSLDGRKAEADQRDRRRHGSTRQEPRGRLFRFLELLGCERLGCERLGCEVLNRAMVPRDARAQAFAACAPATSAPRPHDLQRPDHDKRREDQSGNVGQLACDRSGPCRLEDVVVRDEQHQRSDGGGMEHQVRGNGVPLLSGAHPQTVGRR